MKTRRQNRRRAVIVLLSLTILVTQSTPALAQGATTTPKDGGGYLSFSDVPATHWAYSVIMWMSNNGILNGVGYSLFKPDDPVTREQFAKIMVVALQIRVYTSYTPSFSDVPKSAWSFRFVEAAKPYLTGWRMGPGQLDLFKPGEVAVREDMAVALVKALELHTQTPDLTVLDSFGDKSTTWGTGLNAPMGAIPVTSDVIMEA